MTETAVKFKIKKPQTPLCIPRSNEAGKFLLGKINIFFSKQNY